MKAKDKTNVMRVLDAKKIEYNSHFYEPDASLSGEEIAGILGEDSKCVFKTLVTQGKSGGYFVFVVPVMTELDLKKAAKAAGEKSIILKSIIIKLSHIILLFYLHLFNYNIRNLNSTHIY